MTNNVPHCDNYEKPHVMQDAAPTCVTLFIDCWTFRGHSNGHQGPTKWPLQIPSLTPCYFFFVGACQTESPLTKSKNMWNGTTQLT